MTRYQQKFLSIFHLFDHPLAISQLLVLSGSNSRQNTQRLCTVLLKKGYLHKSLNQECIYRSNYWWRTDVPIPAGTCLTWIERDIQRQLGWHDSLTRDQICELYREVEILIPTVLGRLVADGAITNDASENYWVSDGGPI